MVVGALRKLVSRVAGVAELEVPMLIKNRPNHVVPYLSKNGVPLLRPRNGGARVSGGDWSTGTNGFPRETSRNARFTRPVLPIVTPRRSKKVI